MIRGGEREKGWEKCLKGDCLSFTVRFPISFNLIILCMEPSSLFSLLSSLFSLLSSLFSLLSSNSVFLFVFLIPHLSSVDHILVHHWTLTLCSYIRFPFLVLLTSHFIPQFYYICVPPS